MTVRMRVRDADLRQEIHARGAGPGTDLYRLLRELQVRRDAEQGWSRTPSSDSGDDGRRSAADGAETTR